MTETGDWRCPDCGWQQLPSPLFGWLREHEHAVKVHREVLCPDRGFPSSEVDR